MLILFSLFRYMFIANVNYRIPMRCRSTNSAHKVKRPPTYAYTVPCWKEVYSYKYLVTRATSLYEMRSAREYPAKSSRRMTDVECKTRAVGYS